MEMVLLGVPSVMESVRTSGIAVRQHQGHPGLWRDRGGLRPQLLWVQARLCVGGRNRPCWDLRPLLLHLRLLHQGIQLPEEVMTEWGSSGLIQRWRWYNFRYRIKILVSCFPLVLLVIRCNRKGYASLLFFGLTNRFGRAFNLNWI